MVHTALAVALVGREARFVRDPGRPGPLRLRVLHLEPPERGIAPRGIRGTALELGEVALDAPLPGRKSLCHGPAGVALATFGTCAHGEEASLCKVGKTTGFPRTRRVEVQSGCCLLLDVGHRVDQNGWMGQEASIDVGGL